MRLLVTGARGLLGAAIVREFAAAGGRSSRCTAPPWT